MPKHYSKPVLEFTSLLRNQVLVQLPKQCAQVTTQNISRFLLPSNAPKRSSLEEFADIHLFAFHTPVRLHPSQLCLRKVVRYVVHATLCGGRFKVCGKVSPLRMRLTMNFFPYITVYLVLFLLCAIFGSRSLSFFTLDMIFHQDPLAKEATKSDAARYKGGY